MTDAQRCIDLMKVRISFSLFLCWVNGASDGEGIDFLPDEKNAGHVGLESFLHPGTCRDSEFSSYQ